MRVELTVWDPPTPASRKRTRVVNGKPQQYTLDKDVAAMQWIREAWRKEQGELRLRGPILATVLFFIQAPKGLSLKKRIAWYGLPVVTKRPDLDNYLKQVMDALNAFAMDDDGQITWGTIGKFYALRRDGSDDSPHLELILEELFHHE